MRASDCTDCLIMAGGLGTRLWPASNSRRPKQFLPLNAAEPGRCFFSAAVDRALSVTGCGKGKIIIIAGKSHADHVIGVCRNYPPEARERITLIPEPEAKNTAPAIACAAVYGRLTGGEERTMLVLTSDHIIEPLEDFRAAAQTACSAAGNGALAVFGIRARGPETGYGYIEAETDQNPDGSYAVKSFREKPGRETAEAFVRAGNFYWNSGMFAFSTRFIIAAFNDKAPALIRPFLKLAAPCEQDYSSVSGIRILERWPGLAEAYANTPPLSFDYAIAETCSSRVMIRADFSWTDVGSWDEYARILEQSAPAAEVFSAGSSGCFVDSDIPAALIGVEDLIVAVRSGKDGPASILIAKRGETQKVREIVEQIKASGRTDLL